MNKGVLVGLGANLGNAPHTLRLCANQLAQQFNDLQSSSIYRFAPWGYSSPNAFYNSVVHFSTSLSPFDVHSQLRTIERSLRQNFTRAEGQRYADREVDLDLIDYAGCILHSPDLELPHPRLHLRNFVLYPIQEIYPDYMHPRLQLSINQLLENCTDTAQPLEIINF